MPEYSLSSKILILIEKFIKFWFSFQLLAFSIPPIQWIGHKTGLISEWNFSIWDHCAFVNIFNCFKETAGKYMGNNTAITTKAARNFSVHKPQSKCIWKLLVFLPNDSRNGAAKQIAHCQNINYCFHYRKWFKWCRTNCILAKI